MGFHILNSREGSQLKRGWWGSQTLLNPFYSGFTGVLLPSVKPWTIFISLSRYYPMKCIHLQRALRKRQSFWNMERTVCWHSEIVCKQLHCLGRNISKVSSVESHIMRVIDYIWPGKHKTSYSSFIQLLNHFHWDFTGCWQGSAARSGT